MRYLSGIDLYDLLSPCDLIAAVEQSLYDLADKLVTAPVRQHTHMGDVTLLTMPAVGQHHFGVKIVSVVPSNITRNLPVIHGLMTLYDGATGVPLAVLDAATLTAQRSGALGSLGLKYTTPAEVDSIGIVGPGVQGTWQAIFACAVRPIQTIHFVARDKGKSKRFVEQVSRHVPAVRISRCHTVAELLSKTKVVITATTSSTPVLPDDRHQLEGRHFIGVGSFKPAMQEIPDSVYALAQEVVVDSDAAQEEVGDLIGPLSAGLISQHDIVHLAGVVAGKRRIDTSGTTVFKSVGMALYDLYAAQAFYAAAQRLNRGTLLDI